MGYTNLVTKSQSKELDELKNGISVKKKIRKIITESLDNLKTFNLNVSNPSIYKEFDSVFSNKIILLDEKKIFLQLYSVYHYVLEKNREKGTEIINQISIMVENVNKSFEANYLRQEFNNIKAGAYFELKILDLFRRPKKSIVVTLMANGVELNSSKTDKNGIIIFDNVPKGNLFVSVILKKQQKRTYSIDESYNSKILWFFTI